MIKKIASWFGSDLTMSSQEHIAHCFEEMGVMFPRFHLLPSHVDLKVAYAARSLHAGWEAQWRKFFPNLSLAISTEIVGRRVRVGLQALPSVRNIIAVASGKGGVGKSTVASNLAVALVQEGARVGLVDADVYGPSQVMMMGIQDQKPEVTAQKKFVPLWSHDVQVMSIGCLLKEEQAAVWRGPVASRAMQQLVEETDWQDLDYLIVDMPPGTGDLPLTLAQKMPVTGVVVVTTPQDVALLDVKKSNNMFQKLGIPILGVVENMSTYRCQNCGHEDHLFGSLDLHRLQDTLDLDVLVKLPLKPAVCSHADSGTPFVAAQPDDQDAELYRALARQVGIKLAKLPRDYSRKMPKVRVR